MTLFERLRYRLDVLKIALRAAAGDVRLGFTMKPIAGGAPEGDEGGGDGESGETGDGGGTETTGKSGGDGDSGKGTEGGDSGEEGFDEARFNKAINKKNSENKTLRERLKALEPKAKKADELEEASKTENEKNSEAKTKAEKAAAEATQEAARLRVALNKGLTEVQAKRLIGETQEELEADADELLESFKSKDDSSGKESQEGKKSETPKGGERSGATGDTDGEETDPRKLAARLPSYS